MGTAGSTVEHELARAAGAAHGLVTRKALLRSGVTADEIKHRVAKGVLLTEYKGMYRVGHRAPSIESRYLAAVLACGEGSVLSRRAAGHLYELTRDSPPPRPHVTTPPKRRIEGVETRRSRRIDSRDVAVWRGIPTTSVARTLVDLAAVMSAAGLARACHEAGVRYRTTPAQVEAVLERRPGAQAPRSYGACSEVMSASP